jgi:hypothetical protein
LLSSLSSLRRAAENTKQRLDHPADLVGLRPSRSADFVSSSSLDLSRIAQLNLRASARGASLEVRRGQGSLSVPSKHTD